MLHQKRFSRRSNSGQFIAESPVAMWILFIGLLFPLLAFATFLYRSTFFYFGVRDAAYRAAKSDTWTSAVANGNLALNNDIGGFNGITLVGPAAYQIVIKPNGGAPNPPVAGPLPLNGPTAPNPNNNLYYMQVTAKATIAPLFSVGTTWQGLSIPGLTAPYDLTVPYEVFDENPNGLSQ